MHCGKSCAWPSGGMTRSVSGENTLQRKNIVVKHHIQLVPKKKGRNNLWTVIQLEKEMATYSSTLAWKIPCMEEPGRLQSMGLQRVGHD